MFTKQLGNFFLSSFRLYTRSLAGACILFALARASLSLPLNGSALVFDFRLVLANSSMLVFKTSYLIMDSFSKSLFACSL